MHKFLNLARFFAISVLMVASMVIFGWTSQNIYLVQVHPTFVPMQFNTALCFILSALAFLTRDRFSPWVFLGCSYVAILIAGLTGIQYLIGVELKIDELFIEAVFTTKTSSPGRMAPNTILCFIVYHISLLCSAKSSSDTSRLYALLGVGIVSITGLLSLIGYIIQDDSFYRWTRFTDMAIHTTIAFILLAIAQVMLLYQRIGATVFVTNRHMAAIIFLFTAYLFTLSAIISRENLEQELLSTMGKHIEIVQSDVGGKIKLADEALQRLFKRHDTNSYAKDELLANDIHTYFEDFPYLLSISLHHNNPSMELWENLSEDWQHTTASPIDFCPRERPEDSHTYLQNNFRETLCIYDANSLNMAVINLEQLLQSSEDLLHREVQTFYMSNRVSESPRLAFNFSDDVVRVAMSDFPEFYMNATLNRESYSTQTGRLLRFYLMLGLLTSVAMAWLYRSWQTATLSIRNAQDLYAELNQSSTLLERVTQSIPHGVIVVEKSGKIIFANSVFFKILGYPSDPDNPGYVEDYIQTHQVDKHRHLRESYLEKPTAREMGSGIDTEIVCFDGSSKSVDIQLVPVDVNDAHLTVAIIYDLSEHLLTHDESTAENQTLILNLFEQLNVTSIVNLRLQLMLDMISNAYGACCAQAFTLTSDHHFMSPTGWYYSAQKDWTDHLIFPEDSLKINKSEGIIGRAWAGHQPIIQSTESADGHDVYMDKLKGQAISLCIAIPITIHGLTRYVLAFNFRLSSADKMPISEAQLKQLFVLINQNMNNVNIEAESLYSLVSALLSQSSNAHILVGYTDEVVWVNDIALTCLGHRALTDLKGHAISNVLDSNSVHQLMASGRETHEITLQAEIKGQGGKSSRCAVHARLVHNTEPALQLALLSFTPPD